MDLVKDYSIIKDLFRNIEAEMTKISHHHFSEYNLTTQQLSILLLLDNQGPMRISDIAKTLCMGGSNVSASCSRLASLNLIERFRPKDDQRVVKVQLSAEAVKKMAEIKANVGEFQELVLKNVTNKDLHDIIRGLTKLKKLLDLTLTKMNG